MIRHQSALFPDALRRRVLAVALAPSELVEVAESGIFLKMLL
jgi:hypothetical protein